MDRQKEGLEKLQKGLEDDERNSRTEEDSAFFSRLTDVVKLMLGWKVRAERDRDS